MGIYRDPELSRLHGENLDLKMKLLTVSEENDRLRVMLKEEMDKNVDPPKVPPSSPAVGFVARVKCRWFGVHTYRVEVDAPALWKVHQEKKKLTRHEFFRICVISCECCSHIEKFAHQSWMTNSLGTMIDVISLFETFYQEMLEEHPEWGLEDVQAGTE
jgi:hypothetical protein